ncbi:MAG: hypothetical protein ACLT29_03370, partial [Ruminococcus callidus]
RRLHIFFMIYDLLYHFFGVFASVLSVFSAKSPRVFLFAFGKNGEKTKMRKKSSGRILTKPQKMLY